MCSCWHVFVFNSGHIWWVTKVVGILPLSVSAEHKVLAQWGHWQPWTHDEQPSIHQERCQKSVGHVHDNQTKQSINFLKQFLFGIHECNKWNQILNQYFVCALAVWRAPAYVDRPSFFFFFRELPPDNDVTTPPAHRTNRLCAHTHRHTDARRERSERAQTWRGWASMGFAWVPYVFPDFDQFLSRGFSQWLVWRIARFKSLRGRRAKLKSETGFISLPDESFLP